MRGGEGNCEEEEKSLGSLFYPSFRLHLIMPRYPCPCSCRRRRQWPRFTPFIIPGLRLPPSTLFTCSSLLPLLSLVLSALGEGEVVFML
jgi:hypothetical protein